MTSIYLFIVIFLLGLAIFDLFVGVSNDAVNFLQSAVGAKAAKFRTILIVASAGVAIGAVMSSGMMDVARHGIMTPSNYTFHEVMTIFLAVMVTDIIVLDIFNTLGMPTSTTVSLVFELLGGTFMLASLKTAENPDLDYNSLLNSSKALQMIIAIFISVAISFVVGTLVMWISRLVFTFNYKKHSKYTIAVFGGIAFTALSYFIFLKGVGKSPYIPDNVRDYISENTNFLLLCTFVATTILTEVLYLLRVNIFKLTILVGTFGLAMAFAGNDLVNFIGVPLAGLDAYKDFSTNAAGVDADSYMMTSLMDSAKTPPIFLFLAGMIMIIAMATSKKAKNVIKTSVELARQSEGEEMFGPSRLARAIVKVAQSTSENWASVMPKGLTHWINTRFERPDEDEGEEGAAFDLVRAAVNLVLASMLITFGTNHQLPLSTTYVTFMVAMGSSLADRAWGRESAVFRITGVINVIGGWFLTAGVAFLACTIVCMFMWYGGFVIQGAFIVLVMLILWRSNKTYKLKQEKEQEQDDSFKKIMRERDPEVAWGMLKDHVKGTQSVSCKYALERYLKIIEAFNKEDARELRRCDRDLQKATLRLKNIRREEMIALKKVPYDIAVERNTWFHVGMNSDQQYIYTLRRMLEPIKEHVENNFYPIPQEYVDEYSAVKANVDALMSETASEIDRGDYSAYRSVLDDADKCKNDLSALRKRHLDRMQKKGDSRTLKVDILYLNILQETQQLLSAMRHQLRSAKKFIAG